VSLSARVLSGLWIVSVSSLYAGERQITHDTDFNHELDNNDNFSPDDRFLAFDTRTAEGGIGASRLVAKVEIATGRITPLYRPEQPNQFGPGAGAASFAPSRNEVIFIHGPFRPAGQADQYEKHCRIGGMAAGDGSGRIRVSDARNTEVPYTVSALRGGTHRHEFSGDGMWVGFTYNDAVVRAHGLKIGKHLDLRTIGVTRLGQTVHVPDQKQFPNHAEGFSAVVVVVTADPAAGSEEISNAAGDSWVGSHGYRKPDGQRQIARAFIGTTRDSHGKELDELYIVDIPDDITHPGPLGPLEGTDTSFPMPPAGASQRRLTFTGDAKYPGCQGIVRCSSDGEEIAFRMRDAQGQWQIFLLSPNGGSPRQATFVEGGVDSGVRWHPSGKAVVCTAGTRIVATAVERGPAFGRSVVLSDLAPAPFALVWSHDGKTVAYNRIVKTKDKDVTHIFVADYPDRDGDGIPDGLNE
jgi:hypothetical protein